MSFCPRDGTELAPAVGSGVGVDVCATCRGALVPSGSLAAFLSGVISRRVSGVAIEGVGEALPRCPECAAEMRAEEIRSAAGVEVLCCVGCHRVWLDGADVERARAVAVRPERASTRPPAAVAPATPAPAALELGELPRRPATQSESVLWFQPLAELAIVPVVVLLAWLVTRTQLGDLIAFLPRIQFHELGHAVPAWLTGRAALPLPCGFTFWTEQRSVLAVGGISAAALALVVSGRASRHPSFSVVGAGVLAVLWLGMPIALERSVEWVVAGGPVGEIVFPALGVLAFDLRPPTHIRWDFWRWVLLLPAALALASIVRMWWGVQAGTVPLPIGSFLSSRDSGDGDLDRLMNDHGWTASGITTTYAGLATAALLGALALHFGIASARLVLARRAHASE